MSDIDLDDLRSELDEFAQPEKKGGRPPREERIIAGFEEIQKFVDEHGRAPQHGEDKDIFERLYAVRLDRLRSLEECRTILEPLDRQGLLGGQVIVSVSEEETMDDDELLAELRGIAGEADITQLRHVRTSAEKRAAEEIANRQKCEDFETFKPLFQQIQKELDAGVRQSRGLKKGGGEVSLDEIAQGAFFIVGGQKAYVAEMGDEFVTEYDRRDHRLRVIYDNGTEAEVLQRSFQRALHRDDAARRITDPSAGPLFDGHEDEGDIASGTIYVLRSKSDHPVVAEHRQLVHKIGVTGGSVERRIASASIDPTYLMADVEIVATYELFNINRTKLENLIHRIFDPARLNIEIMDRFGHPVQPREWFLVPLFAVDEAVERIKDGTITGYVYDPKTAKLVRVSASPSDR
jgi:hypothetical protein